MTIETFGYEGEVDEIAYARSLLLAGVRYAVTEPGDFRPTIGAGDRAVTLAAGEAMGGGVRVVSSAPITVSLAAVGSGSRWDLVVLRRTWGVGATIEVIQGTAAKQLPTRNTVIGDIDDQPLALARVASGSTQIAELVDLRCVAGPGRLVGFNDLAASYLTGVGTVLRVGNFEWHRYLDGVGNPTWDKRDVTPDTGWVDGDRNGGWEWGLFKVKRVGPTVWGRLSAIRGVGWSAGNAIGTLPVGFRPEDETWAVNLWGGGGRGFDIKPSGLITADMDSAGNTGVTLAFTFPAKN